MAVGGGAAALALTIVFGSRPLSSWLTTHAGYQVIPSAVAVPYALPGLHVGEVGKVWSLGETAAALVLVGLVTIRLQMRAERLSRSGRLRVLLCGWWSSALAAAAAGALRGAVTAWFAYAGPGGYLTYALFGAAFGLLWGGLLGWIPGIAALLAHAAGRRPRRSATSQAPSSEPSRNAP
ncbi:hypothetical protein GCM10023085_24930 [Actinomadura viridis]|uniref:Uncharacterized protein n=1 Tax=Actinomadura viridis TaxID=58110 RepID=A0A931GQS2_9ACTN|nr:hypothetical protein [Actinomadura viridis]MBG6088864.1 hypothetical protein [Actinomadura viridis]